MSLPLGIIPSVCFLLMKGELDAISQIPVVCEYQDIFPEELPRLPPHRPVEFIIDLGMLGVMLDHSCTCRSDRRRRRKTPLVETLVGIVTLLLAPFARDL